MCYQFICPLLKLAKAQHMQKAVWRCNHCYLARLPDGVRSVTPPHLTILAGIHLAWPARSQAVGQGESAKMQASFSLPMHPFWDSVCSNRRLTWLYSTINLCRTSPRTFLTDSFRVSHLLTYKFVEWRH